MFAHLSALLSKYFEERSNIRQMRMLDDHMLRDIGVERGMIVDAVRHGRDNETASPNMLRQTNPVGARRSAADSAHRLAV